MTTKSSFFSDTPNYATTYPTQNDSNTQPVNGNNVAPSSFYPNGTQYTKLANADTLSAEFDADLAAANTAATNAANSAAAAAASAAAAAAGTITPLMDGVAAVGTSTHGSHEDHVHPTDTTRAPLASPALTGTPTAPTPTASDNSTTLATTAYVKTNLAPLIGAIVFQGTWNASTNTPALASGVGTKGWLYKVSVSGSTTIDGISQWNAGDAIVFNGTVWDKINGVPNEVVSVAGRTGAVTLAVGDVSGAAPLASPTFTGTPTAPTASALTNTTQLATTAYADSAVSVEKARATTAEALLAPTASPALTGTPTAPTAAVGTNTTQLATTAFVLANASGTGVVRYDSAQALTATQEQQARANIGLGNFKNLFRNGTFDIWQRGTSPAAGLGSFVYTADGWGVDFGGALGSVARVSNSRTGANTLYGLQITGIASCTDALIKQRVESYIAARGVSKNVTFQAWIFNNTGGSITPTITVNRCTAQDNWGATASELAATNLQACANGVWTQVAYTFALSSSAGNGIEVYLDFGNNFSSNAKSLIIAEADLQVTPSLATGLQAVPPLPEFRDVATETVLCQRYYEVGTEPEFYLGGGFTASYGYGSLQFEVTKRAAPTVTLANWQYFSGSANTAVTLSILGTNNYSFQWYNTSALTNWNGWSATGTWAASSEL